MLSQRQSRGLGHAEDAPLRFSLTISSPRSLARLLAVRSNKCPFGITLSLPFSLRCRLFNRGRLRDDVRGARQRSQSGAIYRVFTDGGAEERQETQGTQETPLSIE